MKITPSSVSKHYHGIIQLVMLMLAVCIIVAAGEPNATLPPGQGSNSSVPKPVSEATAAANAAVLNELPFQDTLDFQDAMRSYIAPLTNNGVIINDNGRPIWGLLMSISNIEKSV